MVPGPTLTTMLLTILVALVAVAVLTAPLALIGRRSAGTDRRDDHLVPDGRTDRPAGTPPAPTGDRALPAQRARETAGV